MVATVSEPGMNPTPHEQGHRPVLLDEAIELLNVRPGGRYIDATFGGGGHTVGILEHSAPGGRVLALDADPAAVERGRPLVQSHSDRLNIVQANFAEIAQVVRRHGFDPVDGILFDIGLSSFQLDDHARGFSLHADVRLDMRLDPMSDLPNAWQIVNEWPADDIADVIYRYGEERGSRRIARAIETRRRNQSIDTNRELAELVQSALGGRRGSRIHPATRTFQALRIAVNRELDALEAGLRGSLELLRLGGRVAVIAFHSLEDRIVKQYFQRESTDCICPPEVPVCQCGHTATLRLITRRPITPGDTERSLNPRSRSAKLRVAERIA